LSRRNTKETHTVDRSRGLIENEIGDIVDRAERAVLRGTDMLVAPWILLALIGENRRLNRTLDCLEVPGAEARS
jgi:hypothetical protein